jgi:hypothetical protein
MALARSVQHEAVSIRATAVVNARDAWRRPASGPVLDGLNVASQQFNTAAFDAPLPGSVGLESGRNDMTRCFESIWGLKADATPSSVRTRG